MFSGRFCIATAGIKSGPAATLVLSFSIADLSSARLNGLDKEFGVIVGISANIDSKLRGAQGGANLSRNIIASSRLPRGVGAIPRLNREIHRLTGLLGLRVEQKS